MNLYRPPRRGPILAVALLSVGFVTSTAIALWEYRELRRAEDRIEELEAGDAGGPLGDLGAAFEDAFGELGDSLGGEAGGLIGCVFPDEPFSAAPVGGLPVGQQVTEISEAVEDLRELEFSQTVDPRFVPPEEIAGRVQELFLEEYTEVAGDVEGRVLTALGAVPPGTDLRALRSEALGAQVAGFYDPQSGELVVRQAGAELGVNDRVVLAHELDHALTDQALGLPLPDDLRSGREDADLAAAALAEGDATVLMQRYAATLPFQEQLGSLDPGSLIDAIQAQADLAELPPYLQAEALFPYQEGLEFVCDLYADGGWEAVNNAYRDPPDSSVEILAPELYREGFEPSDPTDPGRLDRPWRLTARMQLGAAPLLWLFQAPGGDDGRSLEGAREAAEAWTGGEMHLWTRGADTAVGIVLSERPGQDLLCLAVQEWYGSSVEGDRERGTPDGAFLADGDRQDVVIECAPDEIRFGIAPDLRTARALTR
ncbi:MAG: hypothetical protein ACRDKA_04815 [Actinomycetota bacterium]